MKIGVAGGLGRMGRMLTMRANADAQLAAVSVRHAERLAELRSLLVSLGASREVCLTHDPKALMEASEVVVDFTSPESSLRHAALAASLGKAMVIGTTGLDAAQHERLREAAKKTAIVWSSNMSLGVNLLASLVERAAAALGTEYDIEIFEMHHRHKKDAPSGTALMLGEAAAQGRGKTLEELRVSLREGITGERTEGAIGFASLRGGDVIGDHSVMFAGAGERLELTHRAGSRDIYAAGALHAARWLAGKPPGLYTMQDVLRLGKA